MDKTEYIVNFGYAGSYPRHFDNEREARVFYEEQCLVPSYINPSVKQPVRLSRVRYVSETLETNRG